MNIFTHAEWINKPEEFQISQESVMIQTMPQTDFWQRTFYGFRNDSAPALLLKWKENFTFSIRVRFQYKERFDQAGLILYLDSENWFKASIEMENDSLSRLGSVVTNLGYSDWATRDIEPVSEIWYRLSRRGPDFLLEYSETGEEYQQMRIFHMHNLGETTLEMGKADPPFPPEQSVPFGVYACSPLESSFKAEFDQIKLEECLWMSHE